MLSDDVVMRDIGRLIFGLVIYGELLLAPVNDNLATGYELDI